MAKNFKTENKFQKAVSRAHMIVREFFEKWKYYSFRLGVYNTAWWIGNYFGRFQKLQFWAKDKITSWMDSYLEKNYSEVVNSDIYIKAGGGEFMRVIGKG